MTAAAGSTAGIGGTSTSAAPMRVRARRPGVATLKSLPARTRAVRLAVVPPRVSPLVALALMAVAPDRDDQEPRVPLEIESGPVGAEEDEGEEGDDPGADGDESGPVGRESYPGRWSGTTDVADVAGCWPSDADIGAPAMRPHTVQ
jgi:hypothetical protein